MPENCERAPGGFQMVGRNMKDEDCLVVVGIVEDVLKSVANA